jgi:hypothetical protein
MQLNTLRLRTKSFRLLNKSKSDGKTKKVKLLQEKRKKFQELTRVARDQF